MNIKRVSTRLLVVAFLCLGLPNIAARTAFADGAVETALSTGTFASSVTFVGDDGSIVPLVPPAAVNTPVPVPDEAVDTGDTTGSADVLVQSEDGAIYPVVYNVSLPPVGNSPQSNQPGRYGKQFTPQSTTYYATDSQGHFQSQAFYGSSDVRVGWQFQLSPYLQSIATGPVTAHSSVFRDKTRTSYDYYKTGAPANYGFHSVIPGNNNYHQYQLGGVYTFRVNVGGHPGTATVNTTFNYWITYV